MRKEKIKLSAVSYLNTKPFLHGLYRNDLDQELEINLDIPSSCAQKLINREVDLGLVPVAVIPHLEQAEIISSYCIGTEGEVKTVAIYSQVPIEDITHLYLDYHSRTSAALSKYLLEYHWGIKPILISAQPGYESKIDGTCAGLVIGDRAIGLETQFPYVYDLGTEWKKHTGLPFVFAAWVAVRPLPSAFLKRFNAALGDGIQRIRQVSSMFQSYHSNFDVHQYYTEYISYNLDENKRKALDRFLGILRKNH
ncbi:MAG: menaquinone biosynthesis protein [Saprospiraceae bacterium]|nr:menaquinone biosynthesis protein [Saprospiraceae bacterium]